MRTAGLVDDSFDTEDRVRIREDILVMKEYGVLSSDLYELIKIELIETGESEMLEYTIQEGQYTNVVSVVENTEGRKTFSFRQDDIYNTVTFLVEDGQMEVFLNSKEVRYSSAVSPERVVEQTSVTRNSETDFLVNCPYGTQNDYTNYVGSTRINEIDLQNTMSAIAYGAFRTAVLAVLSVTPGAYAILAGEFWDMVAPSMENVYTWLTAQSPTTYGISYRCDQYYHSSCGTLSGGYISAYGSYVVMGKHHWYGNEDCRGTALITRSYRVHTIY